jgi:hypothetical protein
MLEVMEERSTPTCVVVRCGGKVSGEDYERFLPVIDDAIERGAGHASGVFVIESSPSYGDSRAFDDDVSFVIHRYAKLDRVAFVGDVKWVDSMVRAFAWLTRAEERVFPSDQLDEAIQWATEKDAA